MANLGSDSTHTEFTNERFEDLDLDDKAKRVLRDKGYIYLTHVQSKVLPLALDGKNLVIQSPTGSGKTLCFLLPAVQMLFEQGYSSNLPIEANLLGCVCLAPTRELASQSAIQMHDLARPLKLNAGCCIGGIRDKYDKEHASRLHILTGTPGRVLALLSSRALPDVANVKILVLDEADRLLDNGFRNSILDIVKLLPPDIQILLFSATIKSSLKQLCDVMLRGMNYEYVCLGSDSGMLSEKTIRQEFVVLPQSYKLAALFNLLANNQGKRIMVFLATCKHVRFVYECFKRLIPAVPMVELHGKQSQTKRMEQFTKFAAKQTCGCIFTTDVAARGVDFPVIDIIVQLDLPDSVDTYIHRVGRTGRLSIKKTARCFGRSILFVLESQTVFVDKLKSNGLKIYDQTRLMLPIIAKKEQYVLRKLQAILAKESWIKNMAQRAVVAYMRFATSLNLPNITSGQLLHEIKDLSLSFGLPNAPNIEIDDKEYVVKQKRNKLAKLKETIAKKKQQQQEHITDYEDVEGEEQIPLLTQGGNPQDDIDQYFKNANLSNRKVQIDGSLAVCRGKLRMNRRGIAKIRGVVTIKGTEGQHVTFSLDDDNNNQSNNENEKSFELNVEQLQKDKLNYLNSLKQQMALRTQDDCNRETIRVHEKHKRRKCIVKGDK